VKFNTVYSNINLVSITTSWHLKNAKTRLYVRNTRMKDKGKKDVKVCLFMWTHWQIISHLSSHRAGFLSSKVAFLTWSCCCQPFISSNIALTIISILGIPCVDRTFSDFAWDNLTPHRPALNQVMILQSWRLFHLHPIFIPNHRIIIWIQNYQMPRIRRPF